MHQGVLSDLKVATLPIVAAAGGVVLPALLYLLANGDPATRRGWAIPTATDIAFAVGVLSLIGRSVPAALRMLLLTLAIIDDVVAILVIAFYYSGGVAAAGLLVIAAGGGAGLPPHGLRRRAGPPPPPAGGPGRVRQPPPGLPPDP